MSAMPNWPPTQASLGSKGCALHPHRYTCPLDTWQTGSDDSVLTASNYQARFCTGTRAREGQEAVEIKTTRMGTEMGRRPL